MLGQVLRIKKNAPTDWGATLDYVTVCSGLREINSGIHFDVAVAHGGSHPYEAVRAGVFYQGKHICSIDRGVIPEFKVWDQEMGHVDIPMSEIEKHENTSVIWMQVKPTDSAYDDCRSRALAGDDNYKMDGGKVFHYRAIKIGLRKSSIIRAGWRHTFKRVIAAGIPGVTSRSINAKFGVDMDKYAGRVVPDVVMESVQ